MYSDADAMNEVAWCYLEGFGTKKDKVSRVPFGPGLPSCSCASGTDWCQEKQLHPSEPQSRASDMSQAITAFRTGSHAPVSLAVVEKLHGFELQNRL